MKLSTKNWRRISKSIFLILTAYAVLNITPHKPYMLIALSVMLVLTIFLRTVFCGWICPLGTGFDLLRGVGKWFGSLSIIKPIHRKYKRWVKRNQYVLAKIDHNARYLRYAFLLWILQAAFLGIVSIKNGDEHGIISVLYLLIALGIMGLFVERSWCKYACPVGAVLGVFSKLSPTSVTRNKASCIDCKICSRVCPMNIDVANLSRVRGIDCQTCVKCVDACPVNDALALTIKIPVFNQSKSSVKNADNNQIVLPASSSKFNHSVEKIDRN